MSIEKIRESIDPEDLGITKEELYDKYKEWKHWNEKTLVTNKDVMVSTIFGVSIENKVTLYFLLFGLEVFQYGIKKLKEEMENDIDRN